MNATQSCFASLIAFGCSGAFAQGSAAPAQSEIVQAQATYAKVQLQALAAIYGADPSGGASKGAFAQGMAPAMTAWSSPVQGWPARGPNLGESVRPLMAMAIAGRMGCKEVEGPCQNQAMAQAAAIGRKVSKARNPGAEFAAQVSRLD